MDIWGLMERLGRYYFPVSISFSALTLALVYLLVDPTYGILGAYSVLGLVVAAAMYYRAPDQVVSRPSEVPSWAPKVVYVSCLLSLSLALLTGHSLWVAAGLFVGGGTLIVQLSESPPSRSLLIQILAVFFLSPVVKYLNSGFLLAGSDVARHVTRTQRVLQAENLNGLSGSRYFEFPGLHLITGSTSIITDLSVYDSMMILAPAVLALVVLVTYVVTYEITDNYTYALCVAFAVVLNDIFLIYSSIFHPQSLAFTFVYLMVFVWAVTRDDSVRYVILLVIIIAPLVFTHHLTLLLFAPVVATMSGLYVLHRFTNVSALIRSRPFRTAVIVGVTVTGYWVLVAEDFILEFQLAISTLLLGGLRGNQMEVSYLQYGDRSAEVTVDLAIQWLFSPFGLYLISLMALFSIGTVTILRKTDRSELVQKSTHSRVFKSASLAGMLSAAIMFDTLIGIKSLKRIRLPWVIPFSLVVGYGIYWVAIRYGRPLLNRRNIPWRSVAAALLLISLATTAPLATGDDYYEMDPRPSIQNDFSEGEYRQLQAVGSFASKYDNDITTVYATRLLLQANGLHDMRNLYYEDNEVIVPSGNFVYREQWTKHMVQFRFYKSGFYSSRIVMSEEWLNNHVERSNKTYSSGQVGLLWAKEDRRLDSVKRN